MQNATQTYKLEVIQLGADSVASARRGKDLFYKCLLCEGVIPSWPNDDVGCECGNISIEFLKNTLFIGNNEKFAILQKSKI